MYRLQTSWSLNFCIQALPTLREYKEIFWKRGEKRIYDAGLGCSEKFLTFLNFAQIPNTISNTPKEMMAESSRMFRIPKGELPKMAPRHVVMDDNLVNE
jgi:hypothetical protein